MKRISPAALHALCFSLLVAGASALAVFDDARGRLSLGFLQPGVQALLPLGGHLARNSRILIEAAGCAFATILLLGGAIGSAAGRRSRFLYVAGFAVAAQSFLAVGRGVPGGALYALAALLLAMEIRRRAEEPFGSRPAKDSFDRFDLAALVSITAVAVFFRWYALNQVFDYFEGELSPYSVGATDLRGMLYANVGHRGPWAPLGYFYYLPIFATTQAFGTTVVSLRIASAVVSVLTVPLLYALLRRIAGREAAILGAFVIALDPLQIGWGRTDIHPHGATVWTAILLCWATIAAFDSGRWSHLLLMSVLMGLTFHHYPSGQAAVAIPVVFFAWSVLFDRRRGRRARELGAIALGVGLWLFGSPLQYLLAYGRWDMPNLFTVFGERTSWSQASSSDGMPLAIEVASRSLQNLRDLLAGVFVKVPYLFHQCFIPEYPDTPLRSVVWIVAPFAAIMTVRALFRRGPREHVLLIAWAVCGLLPAVLSSHGYPKRAAITYPALIGLGAVGLGIAWREITSLGRRWLDVLVLGVGAFAAAGYLLASLHQWFSGSHYPYGEPKEIAVAREVEKLLAPGTIVVGDFWNHYNEGKFSYLLLDALRAEGVSPVAWIVPRAGAFEELKDDFRRAIPKLHETMWYKWTPLWYDLPKVQSANQWSAVVFLFQTDSYGDQHLRVREQLEFVKRHCPEGTSVLIDDARRDRRFEIFRCPLPTGAAPEATEGRSG